jgi:hypothetical protein
VGQDRHDGTSKRGRKINCRDCRRLGDHTPGRHFSEAGEERLSVDQSPIGLTGRSA